LIRHSNFVIRHFFLVSLWSNPLSTTATKTQQIIDRFDASLINNLPRYQIALVKGQGNRLWDADGREYLDMFSGFGAGVLGHCHPDLVDALTTQAKALWHVGNLMHTEPQTKIAEALSKHGFGGKSFFCHSGADANDAAFKLARLYGRKKPGKNGNRYKILSCIDSFHGRSFGTMMATGQEKVRDYFQPWLAGFDSNVKFNDLASLKAAIDDDTVALIIEPIQGEGGVNVPDAGYLAAVRALCDERDMLLIFDEVWTGCGRTGKYFAHQHWNVTPDMMTLAKGVGGGLAVGVMCAHQRVSELFDYRTHGKVVHATTLGANCISMAVSARIFEVMERDGLVPRAGRLGEQAVARLRAFAKTVPGVKDARGKGLFLGIELDPTAKGVWFKSATDVVNRCMENGVMINGTQNVVLRIAPSLTISDAELDRGLTAIETAIRG
jgi:acetylornithine/N-succinyldiaminopimelate aminotransferase